MLFHSRDKNRPRRPQSAALRPHAGTEPTWNMKPRTSTNSTGMDRADQSMMSRQSLLARTRTNNARVHNYSMPSPPSRSSPRPSTTPATNIFTRLSAPKGTTAVAGTTHHHQHSSQMQREARHSRTPEPGVRLHGNHHYQPQNPMQSFVKAVNRWTSATPSTPTSPPPPTYKERQDRGRSYDEEAATEQRAWRRRQPQWVRSTNNSTGTNRMEKVENTVEEMT